jgi:predicted small metal-binding protein
MMTYTFTCAQGHDSVTFSVDAENDDDALVKIMEKAAPHLASAHPEMANMPEDEAKKLITGSWVKS